jgi:hypothetical protein
MPPLQGLDSLPAANSQGEYTRELIDFSQLLLPQDFDTQEAPQISEGRIEEGRIEENESVEAVVADVEAVVADIEVATAQLSAFNNKKKRKRVSYAKKRLKAKFTLFLKPSKIPDLQIAFPATYETLEIEGQIKECPRNERKFYRIQWGDSRGDIKGLDPSWLRSELDNTDENKELLLDAIECKEIEGAVAKRKAPPASSRSVLPAATLVTASTSNTPPAHIRAQAVANLRTSASTIGSFSSLSQSTRSSNAVRTRGQKEASLDPDESESENEEEFNLVEEPEDTVLGDRDHPTWEDNVSDITLTEGDDDMVDEEDGEAEENDGGIHTLIWQLKWKYALVDKEAPPMKNGAQQAHASLL